MKQFKWNDKARVHMIEKSELYSDNKFYQYGFYDGYLKAINDCKSNEMFDMLFRISQELDLHHKSYGLSIPCRKEIEKLIKEATEL